MENNQPETPQEQPINPIPAISKKPNVLVIVIRVIVILGIGLLGGYVLFANKNTSKNMSQISNVTPSAIQQPSQAVDQTANWQTYTDNKTFSIKYPTSWKIKKGDSEVGALLYDPTTEYTVTGNGGSKLTRYKEYVAIYSVEKSIKSALQVAQEFQADWKKLNTNIDIQNVDNGSTIIAMYQDAGEGSQGYNYTVSNGSLLAKLNTSASTLQGNATANKVLASFQFITLTEDTSDWHTYSNTAYGYSFKYPSGYKILSDTSQSASFGFSIGQEKPFEYLKVSVGKTTDITEEKSKGYDVTETTISVGGVSAKHYALHAPGDADYEIVQINHIPVIEFNMYVAGGGLSKAFNQMLSTFNFKK